MVRNPVCQRSVRERVPSGVMAMVRRSVLSKRSVTTSVSDTDLFFLSTGMPPMARKKHPSGQKNHVLFIRNPALRCTEA